MKKCISVLVAVLMLSVCSAKADLKSDIEFGYNSSAFASGAPQVKWKDAVVSSQHPGAHFFPAGGLMLMFEETGGKIITASVATNDEAAVADFLCSCLAMLSFLGDPDDSQAIAMLLLQFSSVHKGNEPVPMFCGVDLFEISSAEDYKYVFTYSNNDLAISEW